MLIQCCAMTMKCTVTAEYSAVIAQSIHMVIGYSKSGGKNRSWRGTSPFLFADKVNSTFNSDCCVRAFGEKLTVLCIY